ncbi:MAG: beta-ketoacyl-ACP synthase II [Thermodesulfovibrionales bacterium]
MLTYLKNGVPEKSKIFCGMVGRYFLERRVVVTGIGAVTPLGNSFRDSWDAIKAGRSGTGLITRFDASDIPWKVAGELKSFDARAYLSQKEINRFDPFVQYAVSAAIMAVEDAGLINSNAGVIIGSSRGGITTIEKELQKLNSSRFRVHGSRLSPYLMPSTTVSMAASYAAQKLGTKGYCLGISNACASGTNAVGEALRLIRTGYADLVLAGGAEAPICRLCVEGYGIAGALSKDSKDPVRASKPFDKKRDGFVLSEGACVLVLEDYEHALKRNAHIYGEIIGYGNTTDAFHITRPDPDGEARAMMTAMKEAGITPDDVDYINTHGTATEIGDIAEAEAIKLLFGKGSAKIPVTAIKSMTGHMLAASGAFEIAATLMSMKEDIIPPTINIDEKDHLCDINIVTEKRNAAIRVAISNSFGFGGVNAVIVLRGHKHAPSMEY